MKPASPTIEVRAYHTADWAPRFVGAKYAYRVTGNNGNVITGATTGTRKKAKEIATQVAERMEKVQAHGMARIGFRIVSDAS